MSTPSRPAAGAAAFGVVAVLSFALALPSAAVQQADARKTPTFSAEVNYVEVDATVTGEKGEFIRGLGSQDFEILEDGKPQEVLSVRLIDLPVTVRPPRGAPDAVPVDADVRSNEHTVEARVFVIVMDDLHTQALRSSAGRQVARRFVERYVGPEDLVSVVHTSGRDGLSQDFTTSRSLLLASIDRFTGRKLRSSTLERLDQNDRDRDIQSRADIRMRQVEDPQDAERARDAQSTLRALQSVGDALRSSRGRRKAVLLVSEGIDYELANSVAQTPSGVSTFTSTGADAVSSRMRASVGAMTRGNVAVYAVDPSGAASGGADAIEAGSLPQSPLLGLTPGTFDDEVQRAQDSLRILGEQTGGAASVGPYDLAAAFDRLLRDSSTYYLLGYRSSSAQRDGRYRRIEVKVHASKVRVHARNGYFAPAANDKDKDKDDDARAAGPMANAARPSAALRRLLDSPLPVADFPMRVFAAPFKGTRGNGSVLVGLEADARSLTFGSEGVLRTAKFEAAVAAVNAAGKVAKGDDTSVALRLSPESFAAVQAHGLRLLFRLDLPPGRYQIRTAALAGGDGASIQDDVVVPDYAAQPLALSALVLSSTDAGLTPTPRPDPDLAALLQNPPTGARLFGASETLGVVFALYHDQKKQAGAVDIVTTARGVDDGAVAFSDEMHVSEEELRGAPDGFGYVVKVPLAKLAAGQYVVAVTAKSRLAAIPAIVRELPIEVSR